MRVWCMDDRRGWGRQVRDAAQRRGLDAAMLAVESVRPGDHAFCRVAQDAPRLEADKAIVRSLVYRGAVVVPDMRMIRHYEDKWAQTEDYRRWMPATLLIRSAADARGCLDAMDYPFVSKARHGSASKNIRLVETRAQAQAEIAAAFGDGIPCWGGAQRGYLIWQEACTARTYDYRVHVVGRELAIGRRHCPPGSLFASGNSGRNESPDPAEPECAEVLDFARRFFAANDIRFAAIDIVGTDNGRATVWHVVETSIAWPAHQRPFRERHFVSGRPCAELFDVIAEELEAGVFDATARAAA